MATGRNFSMSGINSGHHNLPTYEMLLKSNNVEFVRYCGGHFENGDRQKFFDLRNQFGFDSVYHKSENFRINQKHISITPSSFTKFCPVVPEICRGLVHGPRKERRIKRIRIRITRYDYNLTIMKSPKPATDTIYPHIKF